VPPVRPVSSGLAPDREANNVRIVARGRFITLEGWSPITEALLMYAARNDHIERVIEPALQGGAWVICDRFLDSTRAYQGCGGGAPDSLLSALEAEVLDGLTPDLTLMLDLEPQVGLARAGERGQAERFEAKGAAFHQRLREAFLEIAAAEPGRCVVVEASGDVDVVAKRIWEVVSFRLGLSDNG
jgi:dTMP kinase